MSTRLIPDETLAIITIWGEAEGEPFAGKLGVAEVIRNRRDRKFLSDGSVAGTIAKSYQFSLWNDDSMNNRRLTAALRLNTDDAVVEDCRRAWLMALGGSQSVSGALLYLNPHAVMKLPSWAMAAKQVIEIGNHIFYAA